MTTRRSALMTLTTAALLFPLALTAHAQKSEEQAIRAAYTTSDTYFRKKDLSKLMGMLTPDIVYKQSNGTKLDRKGMETTLKTQFGMIQTMDSFKTTVKKISVKGKTAQSETSMEMKGHVKDPQGKMHTISSMSTTRDIWMKTAQGWRIKQIDALTDKSMMDGKPIGQ